MQDMKYDLSPDKNWLEYGRKNNVGKYKLVEENLVDAKTGEPPLWVNGEPFPLLDDNIANDPDGATKLMYNRFCTFQRGGTFTAWFSYEWIGLEGGF